MNNKPYIITTDNTTDLPPEFLERHKLPLLKLSYTLEGVCYDGETVPDLTTKEFYDRLRTGAMPVTQQVNPEQSRRMFEPYLKQGLDVLHIAFSSGLSGTCQSAFAAAKELAEEYSDNRVVVVDSLCASMGEGLLVSEALRRQQQDMPLDELYDWLMSHRLNLVHDVVADDLFHLHRGGRVSKTAAIMGSALGIKPLIYLNDEGKLTAFGKMRGKKAALAAMADRLARRIDISTSSLVYICHSDALEDAELLQKLVTEKRVGVENFLISSIGPTIGSHTGTGTVAIFYFAADRGPN